MRRHRHSCPRPVKLFGPSMGQQVFSRIAEQDFRWGDMRPSGSHNKLTLEQVSMLHLHLKAPPQKVEFLAKRLHFAPPTDDRNKGILLATPLYVALSE